MLTLQQLLQKNNSLNNTDLILVLAGAFKKNKEFIYSHPEYQPTFSERLRFFYYLNKLKRGWPVAYILKSKEFFGLNFFVNKNVLIPRPDTEILVEEVIKICQTNNKTLLIDIGTGSGCIPISILKNIQNTAANIQCFAIDISNKALKVAQKNAKLHGVNIKFFHGNLLSPLNKFFNNLTVNQFNNLIITANLPYLADEQMNEPTIKHEPKQALWGGKDGLDLYKKLLEQIKNLSLKTTTFLEIDPDQTEKIKPLIKKYLPVANIEILKDLSGLNRVVKIN